MQQCLKKRKTGRVSACGEVSVSAWGRKGRGQFFKNHILWHICGCQFRLQKQTITAYPKIVPKAEQAPAGPINLDCPVFSRHSIGLNDAPSSHTALIMGHGLARHFQCARFSLVGTDKPGVVTKHTTGNASRFAQLGVIQTSP